MDSSYLSDEEFQKLDYDKLMDTFDNQVANQNQNQQQETPQEQPQEVQQQESSLEEQANFGVNQQNYNNPEQDATTSSQDGSNVDPSIYKDTYERITAPFKASGKEFQVRNVDEAISLMQKGVDYTRKQQALKPRLVEMRTLEEQGMLGDNLNYAIDLYKGNPKAIAKLIKDKGIDVKQFMPQVDEFGNEQPVDNAPYTPNNYAMSPERVKFQEVVDTLNDTGMYSKVDRALDDFDAESRSNFAHNPNYYLVLSDLIQKGHYEPIKQELEHLRIVDDPNIRGKNYMDAFSIVANNYFNQVQSQQPNQQVNQQQFQQQRQYQQVQQRKQGASPVRSSPNRAITQYDPLRCSDEEFAKIDINELMRR